MNLLAMEIFKTSEYLITTPEEFTSFTDEQQKDRLKKYEEDENNLLLVAEYNNELIGMIDFSTVKRKRLAHKGSFGMSVHSGRGGIASLLFGSVGVNDVDNNIKGTYFGSELSAASGYGADAVMAFKDGKMLFLAGPGIGRIFAGSFISGININ